ncbi:hypothetical protein [Brevibacterium album]|uniref:hypothetical protein n=1 Tax=Brevibacterium album TaxID=417948 RepID=UPI00048D269D|nr:hypothetical protein [Brevibacterium album]
MRIIVEIIGIVLLINGLGGLLVGDEFGLLGRVADGGALTALQIIATAVGSMLVGGGLLGRTKAKTRRRNTGKSDTDADVLDDLL